MRFGLIKTFATISGFLAVLVLGGCIQSAKDLSDARISTSGRECAGPSDANCYYLNSPVRLAGDKVNIPGRSYDFYRLAEDLEFVDGRNRNWVAPKETLTDGASIPEIFVRFIGDPTSDEFTNAAALHDAYCGIGNEDGPVYRTRTWQETHRLFYDGLIVGGTPEPKAKLMFAAVWIGGPRWYLKDKRDDLRTALLPNSLKMQSIREADQYIQRYNPSIPQLITYLDWLERRMRKTTFGGGGTTLPGIDGVETPPNEEVISPITGGSGGQGAVQGP